MKPLKILSLLHKATGRIDLYLEAALKEWGISNQEGHLITYLARYAPCPISALHRVFGFKRSTLTSMLDRLEARGLISRKGNAGDRRSILVALKPKGKTLAEAVGKHLLSFEKKVLSRLEPHELQGFQQVMEEIASVTREA